MTEKTVPFVRCQDLFKIYKWQGMEVVALRGLDLEVYAGEFLGIVGSSGSGKTSLLNVLAGLDAPSAGQVTVGQRDLSDMSEADRVAYRRTEVGFLWQTTSRNLLSYLTALENVELPMAILGVGAKDRREWALELLSTLGLMEKSDRLSRQLSGGEQQRVAIAVALANKPRMVIADEPTGELDTQTADEVLLAMQGLCRQYAVTVIVVTHYEGISRFADRVVQIRDGRTVAESVVEPTFQQSRGTAQEEYLVVDRAGRLQLPQEPVERLGLSGLVRIVEEDDGIVIRPGRRTQ